GPRTACGRSHQASDGDGGRAGTEVGRATGRRGRLGSELGRSALSDSETGQVLTEPVMTAPDADMATLARGGRLNVFGFVLRLGGMVPFLLIAGRIYGAAAAGRFAYAMLAVEF